MKKTNEINAFLGSGVEFTGTLEFHGIVRVDGKFTGEARSDGKLIIGEKGDFEGHIEVDEVASNGFILGDIEAKSKVVLHKNSELQGNINTPILEIDEGAVFNGNVTMGNAEKFEQVSSKLELAGNKEDESSSGGESERRAQVIHLKEGA